MRQTTNEEGPTTRRGLKKEKEEEKGGDDGERRQIAQDGGCGRGDGAAQRREAGGSLAGGEMALGGQSRWRNASVTGVLHAAVTV